ncbi:phage terminase small subunit P27 family [Fontivita pretiosa]|uniref:phage terminase small subunit P27 family n=1 Tax=Fontivita pretiosa TaxID=2989684 RepID=UPI003D16DA24
MLQKQSSPAYQWREPWPIPAAPTCPAHLKGEARREWKRIVPELRKLGLLTRIDRAALAAYCQAWGRWVEAEAKLQETGVVIRTKQGNVIHNPYLGVANTAMKLIHKFLTEFGLTPVSRTRVHLAPAPRPEPREEGLPSLRIAE